MEAYSKEKRRQRAEEEGEEEEYDDYDYFAAHHLGREIKKREFKMKPTNIETKDVTNEIQMKDVTEEMRNKISYADIQRIKERYMNEDL